MLKADLGQYFMWHDELVVVTGINNGQREIFFEPVINLTCPLCGQRKTHAVIEGSPNFQEGAKPIETISNK